ARRIDAATLLTKLLAGVPGITTPVVADGDVHTFWRYLVRVDGAGLAGDGLRGGVRTLAADLADQGVASAPRYIQKPAFECEVIAEQRTFGKSRFPFTLARPEAVDYSRELFPGTYAALDGALVLPWN